ncbi:MAG: DinB family protein [Chloroflexota bacterium]
MFSKTLFQSLFAYHFDLTRRLMDLAGDLSAEDYHQPRNYGRGSIHDLFFHLLRAVAVWRNALQNGKWGASLQPQDCPTLAALREGLDREQAAWQASLVNLSPQQIEDSLAMTDWRGEERQIARWKALQHLILHGMQHHSELAQALTEKGCSPGNIDYIFYD